VQIAERRCQHRTIVKFKSIKGTKDILPGEVETWQHVEETIRRVLSSFNYREIRTPIFDPYSHAASEN
jgi:histidyl-tRNA synthetase